MKKTAILLSLLLFVLGLDAQNFSDYFEDKTLRIDYTLSGNVAKQEISVDELYQSPRWYGKRQRLTEVPVQGNASITVTDHHSGKQVYKQTFSTLFQEWLTETDEAKKMNKAFQCPLIVPMPKDSADITVTLFDNYQKPMCTFTHTVNPKDILIRRIGEQGRTPYVQVLAPKDSTHCIHLAYVAEGYRKEEMQTFVEDVRRCMGYLFEHEPFKSLKDRFSIVAVESPSEESGTSEPGKGIWKNTALRSHYDTFYSERYLTTMNLKQLHDILAGIPYEHILILVNSPRYGGGGILNSYILSTTHNDRTPEVVVHEFGHSFAGLADEYAYDAEPFPFYKKDVEPWEPNITTLADFDSKWKDMIPAKTLKKIFGKDGSVTPLTDQNTTTPGLYEGAGYMTKGVYRPCYDCRMRTNENPSFCPVCQRAITRLIDFYTK